VREGAIWTHCFDIERSRLTASCKLFVYSRAPAAGYSPAIVIVAVNVEDLFALDTEDTAALLVLCLPTSALRVTLKARIQ
jgi:hypothetical protein